MEENEAPSIIKVGASGFSYEDWVGPVYPEGMKKGDMLAYYSNELKFDIVELNDTYYTMPTVKGVEEMLTNVPDGFEFVVTAHRSMTRDIRDRSGSYIRDEGAMESYLAGLEPMIDKGCLKCVLARFPLKFKKEEGAIAHLTWLSEKIWPLPLAVEFQGKEWLSQSVFDLLKRLKASYCVVDMPDIESLIRFTPVATAPLAYFRLHGRNKKWFNVPSHVRYDYMYNDSELKSFAGPIRKISSMSEETVVIFNNHFHGSAVANAVRLKEMLAVELGN